MINGEQRTVDSNDDKRTDCERLPKGLRCLERSSFNFFRFQSKVNGIVIATALVNDFLESKKGKTPKLKVTKSVKSEKSVITKVTEP